jgi:hypothetical protein
MNKMVDRDPWENFDQELPKPRQNKISGWLMNIWKSIRSGLSRKPVKKVRGGRRNET